VYLVDAKASWQPWGSAAPPRPRGCSGAAEGAFDWTVGGDGIADVAAFLGKIPIP